MEASAIHAPAAICRFPLGGSLLRLRSDEQLLALFRAGNDEAFRVLHDRYRQRLFAYVRQMLSAGSRQDAEDVLQDVFVRAYGALRNDNREMNVRAWLYRVAHNRCIDHLRRPIPPAAEIFEISRKPLHDPVEEAQRRDDLRQLVHDVANLPEQQRSALLMREIDGMTYADLAVALDVTVPAVKSLLVRARVGLVEAAEARDADCGEIRADLLRAYDRGVKASGRARKHMRSCDGCREYRGALRGMRRSFAALDAGRLRPDRVRRQADRRRRLGRRRRGRGRRAAACRRRRRDRDRLQGRRGRLHGRDRHRRRGRGPARDPRARPRPRPPRPRRRAPARTAVAGARRGRAAGRPQVQTAAPARAAGRAGEAQARREGQARRREEGRAGRARREPRPPCSRTTRPPPPTRRSRPAAPARPTPTAGGPDAGASVAPEAPAAPDRRQQPERRPGHRGAAAADGGTAAPAGERAARG